MTDQDAINLVDDPGQKNLVKRIFIDLEEFEKIKTVATYFVESKALPKWVDNAGKLVMIMQAGRDLGLSVTNSMSGLAIINGVITVYGWVAAMLMKRAGYMRTITPMIEEFANDGARIDVVRKLTIWHKDRKDHVAELEYRRSDATRAGLTTKWDVRKNYPDTMMYRKLLAKARKEFCPEVLDGTPMYEDYIETTYIQNIENTEPADSLAEKIEACVNIEELEKYSQEVAKAKSKDMIALYSAKKRVLSQEKDARPSKPSKKDATNIGEQTIDVWDLPAKDSV